jgi:hypothetical protein
MVALALLISSNEGLSQQATTIDAQRKTVSDERAIAVAWETFATDYNSYVPFQSHPGVTSHGRGPGTELHWVNYVALDFDYVKSILEPKYINSLPHTDGWGNPYQFAVHLAGGVADQYVIRSFGADGKQDGDGTYVPTRTTNEEADIVYSDGSFVTYPEGIVSKPAARPLAQLNDLKPTDHVVALLESTGYQYAKISENNWRIQFKATSVPTLDVVITLVDDLMVASVFIGSKKDVSMDKDTLMVLLRQSNDIDAAKSCVDDAGNVRFRFDENLRTVDQMQFTYILRQVTQGTDELLKKLKPRPSG